MTAFTDQLLQASAARPDELQRFLARNVEQLSAVIEAGHRVVSKMPASSCAVADCPYCALRSALRALDLAVAS